MLIISMKELNFISPLCVHHFRKIKFWPGQCYLESVEKDFVMLSHAHPRGVTLVKLPVEPRIRKACLQGSDPGERWRASSATSCGDHHLMQQDNSNRTVCFGIVRPFPYNCLWPHGCFEQESCLSSSQAQEDRPCTLLISLIVLRQLCKSRLVRTNVVGQSELGSIPVALRVK